MSRRGIGGKTQSSTRLRADNRGDSDITTFFIPGLDVKVNIIVKLQSDPYVCSLGFVDIKTKFEVEYEA